MIVHVNWNSPLNANTLAEHLLLGSSSLCVPLEYLNNSVSCNGNRFAVWSLSSSVLWKCTGSEAVWWITDHPLGIWLPAWFVLGLLFWCTWRKHHHACGFFCALHWMRRFSSLLSLVMSVSFFNFQRKLPNVEHSFFSKSSVISWFWVLAELKGHALTCFQNVIVATA